MFLRACGRFPVSQDRRSPHGSVIIWPGAPLLSSPPGLLRDCVPGTVPHSSACLRTYPQERLARVCVSVHTDAGKKKKPAPLSAFRGKGPLRRPRRTWGEWWENNRNVSQKRSGMCPECSKHNGFDKVKNGEKIKSIGETGVSFELFARLIAASVAGENCIPGSGRNARRCCASIYKTKRVNMKSETALKFTQCSKTLPEITKQAVALLCKTHRLYCTCE